MTSDDVVLFKHAREYIVGQIGPATPQDWQNRIFAMMPKGVIVVIFEPRAVDDSSRPLSSLSEMMVESGLFEDIMPGIFNNKERKKGVS